jgi:ribosomal protein S27AE
MSKPINEKCPKCGQPLTISEDNWFEQSLPNMILDPDISEWFECPNCNAGLLAKFKFVGIVQNEQKR